MNCGAAEGLKAKLLEYEKSKAWERKLPFGNI